RALSALLRSHSLNSRRPDDLACQRRDASSELRRSIVRVTPRSHTHLSQTAPQKTLSSGNTGL
ncbi:unnamed protein product, partial [Callosobruchus maculatus]